MDRKPGGAQQTPEKGAEAKGGAESPQMTGSSVSTAKHERFVAESMEKKKVNEIPGVGGVTAERLKSHGFEYAYQVQGHYLESGMCEESFKRWLKEKSDAGTRTQNACYEAMKDWCDYHHFP